jgi:signal transduction histidine kinase
MKIQEELCRELSEINDNECEPNRYFDQIDKHLKVVNEEIDRLNAIVVDFLFAVRPINAKLRKGDLNALITELAEFVSPELKNSNIHCVLNLAETLSAIDFDAGLMKRALLNVIQNAAAAMGSGGRLTIATEDTESEALIVIADTGTGISDENLSKIFEPYFTTKENGTGLGLTVLFKIIKEHQGEVTVRSREGEGTVFTISLPKPQTEQRLITYGTQTASAAVSESAAIVSGNGAPVGGDK